MLVFYSERGDESALTLHTTEADACANLLDRLIRDDQVFFALVSGPAPVSEADAAFDSWLSARGLSRATLVVSDWKFDDVPWVAGRLWRRYFVRITAVRLLDLATRAARPDGQVCGGSVGGRADVSCREEPRRLGFLLDDGTAIPDDFDTMGDMASTFESD